MPVIRKCSVCWNTFPTHKGPGRDVCSLDCLLASGAGAQRANGCIEWQLGKNGQGYGLVTWKGKSQTAHRATWLSKRGTIPDAMCVCHTCDNRCCVNIEHLFLGTNADNTADRHEKQRDARQVGSQNGQAKLTEADVLQIRSSALTGRELAIIFGVNETTISAVRRGVRWLHV